MKTLKDLNVYSTSSVTYTDQSLGSNQLLSNRYQINGLLDTSKPVLENIEKLCNASGSWLSYDIHEGKWGVVINQSGTSVVSFNDSNIIGSISVSGTGLQDLYNSTKVEFPHRELRDSADFVTVEIPAGDRNSNEADNVLNITYDVINEPVQAQILGLIELKQSRIDQVIKFTTDFSYINLKAGDIIDVTDSRFGFTAKKFRIVTITEVQDDAGALMMEITALEYKDTVYTLDDLYRYTRTDENGIITIGNIGTPGTPQITKYQVDARPRVIVESTAPSGVVEGMEYWITTDYSVPNDANRSYKQLATIYPIGGGIFTSGQTVTLDHDNIDSGSYFIKTRGFNARTVGPYSTPAGFVFTATQLTQAIGPNTKTLDTLGNIATLYATWELLKGLDGLYQKVASTSSMFTKIFETFKDATGIDLVGQASSGALSPLVVKDEGITLTTATGIINFVGAGVTASKSGDVITVTIPGSGGGGGVGYTGSQGPVGYTGSQGSQGTGGGGGGGGTTAVNLFSITNKLPPDRTTALDPITGLSSDKAPTTGSYYIVYSTSTARYGSITAGSGNVDLYKSDGTLASRLSANELIIDNNVIGLPFPTRDLGTDYYILMDQGVVKYCDTVFSPAISSPTVWNFNTPPRAVANYTAPGALGYESLIPYYGAVTSSGCNSITLSFSTWIIKGSGTITIRKRSDNSLVETINVSSGRVTISQAFATVSGLNLLPSTIYDVTVSQGSFLSNGIGTGTISDCHNGASNPEATNGFTTSASGSISHTSYVVDSTPFVGDTNRERVNKQTNIRINFGTTPVYYGSGFIKIYKSDGTLHQSINVASTFEDNKVSEILLGAAGNTYIIINPTTDFSDGEAYYLVADAGTLLNGCSKWAGTTDPTTFRWTIDPGPTPSFSGGSSTNPILTLNYDRAVTAGTGVATIKDGAGNVIGTIAPTIT